MNLLEWLSINTLAISSIKDIVLILAAMITGIVAIIGLNTWRKELKGKTEYQLAKDILKAVYEVGNAFTQVRLRAIFYDEYPEDSVNSIGEIKKGKEYEVYSFIYNNRWKILSAALLDLEKLCQHPKFSTTWKWRLSRIIVNKRIGWQAL